MVYVATKNEITNFHYLYRELFRIIGRYNSQNDVEFEGLAVGFPDFKYGNFIVQKKSGFIKTILKISPPYTTKDVKIRNRKYRDLGEQIKDEIAKFWNFGMLYQYKGEEEVERGYAARIELIAVSHFVENTKESYKSTDEKRKEFEKNLEKALREVETQRFKEFIESRN